MLASESGGVHVLHDYGGKSASRVSFGEGSAELAWRAPSHARWAVSVGQPDFCGWNEVRARIHVELGVSIMRGEVLAIGASEQRHLADLRQGPRKLLNSNAPAAVRGRG
ncbi:hypothetical protein D3C83_59260 [compost metagenome]